MVAVDEAATVAVEIVNVAFVAPAGTVALAGTVATLLLLDSATANPPDAAAAVSVTVPCTVFPPVPVVGLRVIAESAGADGGGGGGGGGGGDADVVTVSVRDALRRSSPEIVTVVLEVTDDVVIGNVADAAPAGTVTVAGTRAAVFELNS
jgi:hypothetical protein